jgi:hypothetical protein
LLYRASQRFYPVPYEIGKLFRLALVVGGLFFLPRLVPAQTLPISIVMVLAYFPLLSATRVLSMAQIKAAGRQLLTRKAD